MSTLHAGLEDGALVRVRPSSFACSDEFLHRVGASNVPVLLHGETGAGKEVMARRLWAYSKRADKPFLKINCAALPSELIESELFGYEKGAFTGATMDKPGKFELAQGGTILLDEIGDMDIRLQAKLLQVLQDGEVHPLGSSRIVEVNVRVLAATHRDLRRAIRSSLFREDLYYRLDVVSLTIPPLRERLTEILPLAHELLERHRDAHEAAPAITAELGEVLLAYPWPGNVRELENVMRRLLIYRDAGHIARELIALMQPDPSEDLPELGVEVDGQPRELAPISTVAARLPATGHLDLLARASREAELKLLRQALDRAHWNRRRAAASLHVDYKAFLYKLRKYGIAQNGAAGAQNDATGNGAIGARNGATGDGDD